MSLRMVIALPGHGKGRFMTEEIVVSRLAFTERVVVTSMTELRPDKIASYLEKRFPGRNIDLNKRLFFIPKDDVASFYRYRGRKTYDKPPSLPLTASIEEKDRAYEEYFAMIDREGAHKGVDYFLTEAHRHFKADTWKEIGHQATFYISQHRHMDDNLWIETQWPKMVVVQMRDLTEETILLRNHYKESFALWKKPGCFRIFRYYGCPKNLESAEPYHTGAMKLDADGLASCYYTRGALGERATGVETDTSKKALPFWTVVPAVGLAIAVIVAAVFFLPKVGMVALSAWMKGTSKAAGQAISDVGGLEQPAPVPPILTKPQAPQTTRSPERSSSPAGEPPEEVYATGLMYGPKGVIVLLSDGTRKSTVPGIIEEVRIKGRTYQLRAPVKTAEPEPARPIETPKTVVPATGQASAGADTGEERAGTAPAA